MKNYKEVADDVLRRSEEIIENNQRRKRKMMKVCSLMTCLCLMAILGFGAWHGGMFRQESPMAKEQFAPGNEDDGKTDVVVDISSNLNGNTGSQGTVESTENNGTGIFGGAVMRPDTDDFELPKYRTMISSYGDGNVMAGSYATPKNGTVQFSIPLKGALDEYGYSDEYGDILYRVAVDVFKDQNMLDKNSTTIREEGDRLFQCGYTVAMETYNDGQELHYYFTLHATKEQLIDFAVNEEYGYMFFLYDEYVS